MPLLAPSRAGTVVVFGALYCKSLARPAAARHGAPKRSLSDVPDSAAAPKPGDAQAFDAEAPVRAASCAHAR